MKRLQNPNLELLALAVKLLEPLLDKLVFVGGCATGLLITDTAAAPIRATRDVDAIVELGSYLEYSKLSEQLRQIGFNEDTSEGAPMCRWVSDSVVLDIMPTEESALGFGNRWYASAARNSIEYEVTEAHQIRMVSAPYFLVTKLAAFSGRGGGDFMMSHDMEDIISVIDGRPELLDELGEVDIELQRSLQEEFARLLSNPRFVESVSGHMPGDGSSQARVPKILKTIEFIASPDSIGFKAD